MFRRGIRIEVAKVGGLADSNRDDRSRSGNYFPLAADVRKWADGKQLAKLKLIAGLLDLPLDQLRRRELQKRRKTMALMLAAYRQDGTMIPAHLNPC